MTNNDVKQEKNITQQWVKREVFEAMVKCATFRPDLQIHVSELERNTDGDFVRVKIHINGGRTLFAQKLTHFLITSLLEYKNHKD
jgi:hypothetical protein